MKKDLFAQVYEHYNQQIYLYLYSLCKNRELAEDIMQETFLKAMLSLTGEHNNIKAWLYLVGRNLLIDHIRKAGRERPIEEADDPPDDTDLLSDIIADEDKRLLYRAIQKLDAPKREAITLQYSGGFSQKEIAAIMKIKPGNVRVLIHRAKTEIRMNMEENGYEIS